VARGVVGDFWRSTTPVKPPRTRGRGRAQPGLCLRVPVVASKVHEGEGPAELATTNSRQSRGPRGARRKIVAFDGDAGKIRKKGHSRGTRDRESVDTRGGGKRGCTRKEQARVGGGTRAKYEVRASRTKNFTKEKQRPS